MSMTYDHMIDNHIPTVIYVQSYTGTTQKVIYVNHIPVRHMHVIIYLNHMSAIICLQSYVCNHMYVIICQHHIRDNHILTVIYLFVIYL